MITILGPTACGKTAVAARLAIQQATGIREMEDVRSKMSDVWYDLSGRRLDGKPAQRGIYIYKGKKIIR